MAEALALISNCHPVLWSSKRKHAYTFCNRVLHFGVIHKQVEGNDNLTFKPHTPVGGHSWQQRCDPAFGALIIHQRPFLASSVLQSNGYCMADRSGHMGLRYNPRLCADPEGDESISIGRVQLIVPDAEPNLSFLTISSTAPLLGTTMRSRI
jgi:hypothetical protein